MADIASVFYWPPSTMNEMELDELYDWHERAQKRRVQAVGFIKNDED